MDWLFVRVAAVLVALLPYASAAPDDVSRCPQSLNRNQYLHAFRERCYEFVVYRETYWNEAQNECLRRGGRLVTIEDKETQTFLENTTQSLHFQRVGLWIGLTDRRQEGSYEWVSGTPMKYTNWAQGEPALKLVHHIDDCIMMEKNKGYRWVDVSCNLYRNQYGYTCEYAKIPEHQTLPPKGTRAN